MSGNEKKILDMLVSNKINMDEACRLLFVVEPEANMQGDAPRTRKAGITRSQYLRACVMAGFDRFR
jgi:hypothetical protein